MKKEIARKWVTALRSKKYKQTKGTLRTVTGFCCLGVLCDLFAEEFPSEGKWIQPYHYVTDFAFAMKNSTPGLHHATVLPILIREWAGMKSRNGEFSKSSQIKRRDIRSLSEMNDDGESFKTIARLIESESEDL